MKPERRKDDSQTCWIFRNDRVELSLTCLGGQMTATFRPPGGKAIRPYYVSPWQGENPTIPDAAKVLIPLRGDFFVCHSEPPAPTKACPTLSTANPAKKAGIPTTSKLSPKKPTLINYIQGVARIPQGFDRVKRATFAPGRVTFISQSGKQAMADVHHEFLASGLSDNGIPKQKDNK